MKFTHQSLNRPLPVKPAETEAFHAAVRASTAAGDAARAERRAAGNFTGPGDLPG